MVKFKALPVFLFVTGLLSETLCFLTLEAEAGDKVTIWCEHDPTVANYIFWFKHTSDSVPLRLGCKQFLKKSPAKNCYFITESKRIVMSVYGKNTSLTITAVNVSDTGLYYCSYSEEIIFSNSTSLHVKGKIIKVKYEDKATGSDSPVLFLLTVVFGALSVILFSVLIFIILKHRKTHSGAEAEDTEINKSSDYEIDANESQNNSKGPRKNIGGNRIRTHTQCITLRYSLLARGPGY